MLRPSMYIQTTFREIVEKAIWIIIMQNNALWLVSLSTEIEGKNASSFANLELRGNTSVEGWMKSSITAL